MVAKNTLTSTSLASNSLPTPLEVGWLDLNPFGQNFSDALDGAAPKDLYRFSLQAASQVTLNLGGLSDKANLFLGDARGHVLASSKNLGTASELIVQSLKAGTYYVLVNSPQLDGYPATTYNLDLSAQFLTDDVIVSDPNVSLPDPEFDWLGNRITWQDVQGNLWVAPVDPESGDFILEEAIIIDTGLAPQLVTRGGTANGPEWVYTQNGSEIVYTKLIEGSWFLGHAQWNGSRWEAGLLTDETGQAIAGSAPVGTLNPQDPSPLINYARPGAGRAWLELENPSVGGLLPGAGVRWVEGEPAVLLFSQVDGIMQAFKNEVYTGIQTQLTFDNTNKKGDVFMWRAPEFDNEQVFFSGEVLDDRPAPALNQLHQVGIYREIDGQWVRIKVIQSPSEALPFIHSPEPLVYNGRSYISMVLSTQTPNGNMSLQGSEVWITSIDPADNFWRRVSQEGNVGGNNDPESFVTQTGAFIYYTEVLPDQTRVTHKAATGLGLPLAQHNDIIGTSAADTLVGTSDSDRLIGGMGSDTLTGGGGNDLFISINLSAADGAGNTLKNARRLGFLDVNPTPQTFSDRVNPEDQKDLYRFELEANSRVQLTLNSLTDNGNLHLVDASGAVIFSSLKLGGTPESITTDLDAGTYYVLVNSVQQADTNYELAVAARFLPEDIVVSNANFSFRDPEFDGIGHRVTWQDKERNIWVAPVDPKTGNLILERAEIIASNVAPLYANFNGPEWLYTEDGSAVVYTTLSQGEYAVAAARWNGSDWITEIVTNGQGERVLYGTKNPGDLSPLISFFPETINGPVGGIGWQSLENPEISGILPNYNNSSPSYIARWVEGEPSLTTIYNVNGIRQVFKYDIDTDTLTQITFSDSQKGISFMWRAPEFNNELVLLVVEAEVNHPNEFTEIGIYRNLEGEWTKIHSLKPPSNLPFIYGFSPETFTYNGKSYVSLTMTDDASFSVSDRETEIWIAGIDPGWGFYRQVAEGTDLYDPESLVTDTGVFIYYSHILNDGVTTIRRVDLALAPSDGAGNNLEEAQEISLLNSLTTSFSDLVSIEDQKDFYRFNLSDSNDVEIGLAGLNGNANLFLLDVRGNIIASSTNLGNEPESILATLSAGSYYILASSAARDNYPLTAYDLNFSLLNPSENSPLDGNSHPIPVNNPDLNSEDGAGNQLRDARPIGLLDATPIPQILSDSVSTADLRDFYGFELQTRSNITLSLKGLSANANLFLINPTGGIVASSSNQNNAPESVTITLDPGSYYVLVNSVADAHTDYELTLAAQFIVNDLVLEPNLSIPDPEFAQPGHLVTWRDRKNNLWVASMDAQTGDLLLETALLIDSNLAPIGTSGNGPEWIYTKDGPEIIYTKLINGNWSLGHAQRNGSQWAAEILEGSQNSHGPLGTLNPNEENPLILYWLGTPANPAQKLAWRDLENPNLGGEIPNINGTAPIFSRWVQGERALLLLTTVDGITQVFKYDIDTDTLSQITFSTTQKGEPFMWHAPEFNNELVFFSPEKSRNSLARHDEIGLYRNVDGTWTKIKTIKPPSSQQYIHSAEFFVYNGKSYIFLITTNSPNIGSQVGAEVWIAGIEPESDFYRQVNSDGNLGINNDPEALLTESGLFIYYNEISSQGTFLLHRAETGLGVPNIIGTSEADTLAGTSNDDRLIGGMGADTLTGGGGKDLFIYQNAQEGRDIIIDFAAGQDKIDLAQVFASLGYQGNTPLKDGYLQLVNSSSAGGVIVRIDPDGKEETASFSPLAVVTGVDAATLISQNSVIF